MSGLDSKIKISHLPEGNYDADKDNAFFPASLDRDETFKYPIDAPQKAAEAAAKELVKCLVGTLNLVSLNPSASSDIKIKTDGVAAQTIRALLQTIWYQFKRIANAFDSLGLATSPEWTPNEFSTSSDSTGSKIPLIYKFTKLRFTGYYSSLYIDIPGSDPRQALRACHSTARFQVRVASPDVKIYLRIGNGSTPDKDVFLLNHNTTYQAYLYLFDLTYIEGDYSHLTIEQHTLEYAPGGNGFAGPFKHVYLF